MNLDMYIEELVHEHDRDPSNATLVPKVGAQLYSIGQMPHPNALRASYVTAPLSTFCTYHRDHGTMLDV